MKIQTTLYHRTSKGKVNVWSIWRFGNFSTVVYRRWGEQGGQMQNTTEWCEPKKGKTAVDVAREFYNRHVERKRRSGFVADLGRVRKHNQAEHIDMSWSVLPTSFAPQKPIQDPPTVINSKDYIIMRKRDGQRHYAVVDAEGKVKLYSSKMHDMTQHMPMIVRELEEMELPKCSLIDGEIVCDRKGQDDFRATSEVCRAHPRVAQMAERRLPIRYMPFDYLLRDNAMMSHLIFEDRFQLLNDDILNSDRIIMPEVFTTFERATRVVKQRGWEGLVLWKRDERAIIRMDGKHARHGSYKWKPVKSGEFVALGWLPGKGRNANVMGKLRIGQRNKEICRVGTGFTNQERIDAMRWRYPCVVELKYAFQQEDTHALREPVFLRKRPDKSVKDLR